MAGRARTAAQAFQFGFQLANALLEFRQTIKGSDSLEPLTIVDGGIAGVHRTWRDVVGNTALGGNDAAIADGEMSGRADLAGENAAVADLGGSGEADLAAEHGIGAYAGGVADDDEVVELGAPADASFTDGSAVDAGVGLDFDVIFKDCRSRLLHFVPGSVALLGKTKSIAADDDTVLKDDAIADLAEFSDDGMGVGEEIIADARALVNGDKAVKHGVAADMGVCFNNAIGAYVSASADFGRLGDECGGVEAGLIPRSLIEKFDGVSEGEVRIGGAQGGKRGHACIALDADAFLDEHCGGAGGFEKREVAPIGEECNLARLGVFDAGDAMDGGFSRAIEAAAELLGNVGEFDGHEDSSLGLSASLAHREA